MKYTKSNNEDNFVGIIDSNTIESTMKYSLSGRSLFGMHNNSVVGHKWDILFDKAHMCKLI